MGLIDIVDKNGKPTNYFGTRESVHRGEGQIHPLSHVIILDYEGKILSQERINKKFLNKLELPLSGGHLEAKDRIGEKLSYKKGAIREVKQEIGIDFSERELKQINGLSGYVDLTDLSGFANKMYVKVFKADYDKEKHGNFKLDNREVGFIKFRTYEEIKKEINLPEILGEYGQKIEDKLYTLSRNKKIKRKIFDFLSLKNFSNNEYISRF